MYTPKDATRRELTKYSNLYSVNKPQVILCTHAGRPKGEVVESMRIGNIGGCLGDLLEETVACPEDCVGSKVEEQVKSHECFPRLPSAGPTLPR